jgi:hypothetical protein
MLTLRNVRWTDEGPAYKNRSPLFCFSSFSSSVVFLFVFFFFFFHFHFLLIIILLFLLLLLILLLFYFLPPPATKFMTLVFRASGHGSSKPVAELEPVAVPLIWATGAPDS